VRCENLYVLTSQGPQGMTGRQYYRSVGRDGRDVDNTADEE
jgi:hypothetical protein